MRRKRANQTIVDVNRVNDDSSVFAEMAMLHDAPNYVIVRLSDVENFLEGRIYGRRTSDAIAICENVDSSLVGKWRRTRSENPSFAEAKPNWN